MQQGRRRFALPESLVTGVNKERCRLVGGWQAPSTYRKKGPSKQNVPVPVTFLVDYILMIGTSGAKMPLPISNFTTDDVVNVGLYTGKNFEQKIRELWSASIYAPATYREMHDICIIINSCRNILKASTLPLAARSGCHFHSRSCRIFDCNSFYSCRVCTRGVRHCDWSPDPRCPAAT